MDTFDIVKTVSMKIFKYKLTFALPVQRQEQHQEFLEKNCFVISDATRIEGIWMKLSSYWNYLNFSLLEHVIKMFCSEALMARMEEYKKKLEVFRCKTRLCVFAQHYKNRQKCLLGNELKEFVIKHDKKWTECTLQDLENWKESLTQKLLLPSFAVNPKDISTGSVSITWAIPAMFTPSLVEKLKSLDENFCKEHKIMSLTLDGVEYLGAPDKDTGEFYAVHTDMD